MPRLIVTAGAVRGLDRCRRFLSERHPQASRRAAQVISRHLAMLEESPEIGRPVEGLVGMRELIIPFGASGYAALYRYGEADDAVYVLAFRHQREAGY